MQNARDKLVALISIIFNDFSKRILIKINHASHAILLDEMFSETIIPAYRIIVNHI